MQQDHAACFQRLPPAPTLYCRSCCSLLDRAVVHAAGEEQDLPRRRALAGIHVADEHNVQVLAAGQSEQSTDSSFEPWACASGCHGS